MARALVCWIGNTDLRAAEGQLGDDLGPIGFALKNRPQDHVLLLSNYSKAQTDGFVRWARKLTDARVEAERVTLEDPTEFGAVYRLADAALTGLKKRLSGGAPDDLELTLHLSPGTPAMAAIWIILGKTRHPAELIQTSRERGLKTAAIPLDIAAEFVDLIPQLLRQPDASLEARSLAVSQATPRFGDIVYRCAAMEEAIARARRVAARSVSVLIEGESGTGKELLARAIHQEGPRRGGPFIAVNCGALPQNLVESLLFGDKKGAFTGATGALGHFRMAQGGTLFLDEIGELPLDAQVKLLRALQQKAVTPVGESKEVPVDVRVIAATNRNLAEECRAGRFRDDLFYRLAIAVLRLPPLRERKGDVGVLLRDLLEKANQAGEREEPGYVRKAISPGAKNLLLGYSWPGNVRELENTLMRASVWTEGPRISERDVVAALLGAAHAASGAERLGGHGELAITGLEDGFNLDEHLSVISRRYVKAALEQADGNKSAAAKLLGLASRQTLNNRMRSLGLDD
jgi:DNA-binding NtrC family response regulator